MPPKAKFTREEIVDVALSIVRAEGLPALTARSLGAKLGSSARPIFTVFRNMDELQQEVVAAAKARYAAYVREGLSQTKLPAFKGVGSQYISFACTEPKLFQLLFMSEQPHETTVANVLPAIEEHYEQIVASIEEFYGLDEADSVRLYRHLWIYTHGIAVLCVTNLCTFTMDEISQMLTEVFLAMLMQIRSGHAAPSESAPEHSRSGKADATETVMTATAAKGAAND